MTGSRAGHMAQIPGAWDAKTKQRIDQGAEAIYPTLRRALVFEVMHARNVAAT